LSGFLGSATWPSSPGECVRHSVSIPSRVFCVLRPCVPSSSSQKDGSFNPFSGFLGSATTTTRISLRRRSAFQSLLGFSGFCDKPPATGTCIFGNVSIPSRVFWVLRPSVGLARGGPGQAFQSLLGFSGFCDRQREKNLLRH